jgi:hypothetical protein
VTLSRALVASVVLGVAGTALAGLQACGGSGSHEGSVAPGDPCEQATDCQAGYVCIAQTTGPKECCGTQQLPSGQCAANLSSIQMSEVDGGDVDDAPAGMMPEAAAATD